MNAGVRRLVRCLCGTAVAGCAAAVSAALPAMGPIGFNTTTAAVSERVVGRIGVTQQFENPYDPDCVRLDAEIAGPAGRRLYPCFYCVPVDSGGRATGPGEWLFRHAFRMEGAYTVAFRLRCAAGEAVSPASPIVVRGRRPGGFVQPDRFHHGVWMRDDGVRFFASGLNMAWYRGDDRAPYTAFLDRCEAAGIRMVRVWMVGFARQEIEWSETLWTPWNNGYGLGRYNQRTAALFDWLLEEAERREVAIQLVLETHGEWGTEVDSNWEFNPYNAAHGGFLTSPAEFFTDPGARRLAQARYRYCVARWGAEPALAAWELFNEADHSDAVRLLGDEASVAAWHQEHARYLQRLDAVPRPVVSSASDPEYLLRLARMAPALDRLDIHFYRDDAVRAAGDLLRRWRTSGVRAALVCGEFGMADENELEPRDLALVRAQVRRMAWRGRLAGIPAWYWFWNKAEAAGAFDANRALSEAFSPWLLEAEHPLAAEAVGGPPVARLTATPALGWEPTVTNRHGVAYDGATNIVLHGQSAYLRGDWNGAKGRELSLSAVFADEGAFEVAVDGVSAMGANELVIEIDGEEVWRRPTAAGIRLLVSVGEGAHTLRLVNAGSDWIRLGPVAIVRCADSPAEAVAVSDGWRAVAYVADKRFLAGSGGAGTLDGVTLWMTRPPLLTGMPSVRFIDPADGSGAGDGVATADESGCIRIALPPFVQDLAVVLE